MPTTADLLPLIIEPREDLGAEYKQWIELGTPEGKATLAKAAIALANHGGGFLVLGFQEGGHVLEPYQRPPHIPLPTQDEVNSAIRRFVSPEFHCEVYNLRHPEIDTEHTIVAVPGTITVPVMSKRGCDGVLIQNRCYIRKSGPRSEEPQNAEEWRRLLERCVRANRDDLLEAIRAVISGRVEPANPQ